ncbi:hypothetical protein [Luteolibacter sp. Populi]|uniref:hypothetical protein n=1 Tax=Luteolibacter sp. Populi TaxID=3230487 RepID=UPI0034671634
MNTWSARLVCKGSPAELVSGWRVIRGYLGKQLGIDPETNFISQGVGKRRKLRDPGKALGLDEIENEILLDDSATFRVGVGGPYDRAVARVFGSIPGGIGDANYNLSVHLDSSPDWVPLMRMAGSVMELVYGFSYNPGYLVWQSEMDIGRYENNFGSAEQRPKIMKGEPPIDRLVIDTSRNPGTLIRENGEFMGVAADMWFAPRFWERRKLNPADVLRAVPGATAEEVHGLTRIRSHEREFDRPDGEQGEIQKALWKVLFGREVKW